MRAARPHQRHRPRPASRFSDAGADAGRVSASSTVATSAATPVTATPAPTPTVNGGRTQLTSSPTWRASRNPALGRLPERRRLRLASAFQTPPSPIGDGTFNVPPIIEAADTGPFFHTDTQVIGAAVGKHVERPDHRAGGRLLQLAGLPASSASTRRRDRERRPLPARHQRRLQHPDGRATGSSAPATWATSSATWRAWTECSGAWRR